MTAAPAVSLSATRSLDRWESTSSSGCLSRKDSRTADLLPAPGAGPIGVSTEDNLATRALGLAAPRLAGTVNSREWRAAELPAANGHGNGRSLAAIYSALALGGGDLLSRDAVEDCGATEHAARDDMVLGFLVRRSLGFILSTADGRYEWGPNPRTFGHSGAGGSLGFADPDAEIGFGYVMNQMSAGLGADPRWKPMIRRGLRQPLSQIGFTPRAAGLRDSGNRAIRPTPARAGLLTNPFLWRSQRRLTRPSRNGPDASWNVLM